MTASIQTRTDLSAVSRRLRELREQHDITKAELADWSGIKRSNVCRYEAGERMPTLSSLVKYGIVFRMSVSEILDGVI